MRKLEGSACTTDRSGELDLSRFVNTGQMLQAKKDRSLRKYQERMQVGSRRYSQQIRGVSLEKQIARASGEKEDPSSERIFKHYEWFKPDVLHTSDFGKRVSRRPSQPEPELPAPHNVTQDYLKYYYPATTFKCTFDMAKSLPRQHKPHALAPPPQLADVINGEQYLGIKNCAKIAAFWNNAGRDLPCPTELRGLTNLTDHWRQGGKFSRQFHPAYDLLQQALSKRRTEAQQRKQRRVRVSNYCEERQTRLRGSTPRSVDCL